MKIIRNYARQAILIESSPVTFDDFVNVFDEFVSNLRRYAKKSSRIITNSNDSEKVQYYKDHHERINYQLTLIFPILKQSIDPLREIIAYDEEKSEIFQQQFIEAEHLDEKLRQIRIMTHENKYMKQNKFKVGQKVYLIEEIEDTKKSDFEKALHKLKNNAR